MAVHCSCRSSNVVVARRARQRIVVVVVVLEVVVVAGQACECFSSTPPHTIPDSV